MTISCTHCGRTFRTVWSVVERYIPVSCAGCGHPVHISRPQPLSVLSDPPAKKPARSADQDESSLPLNEDLRFGF